MTDHTCFYMKYRKSPKNDDAIQKEERWVCDNCHTERIVVKEIPNPTEKSMLVKHLMSLSERYELAGMTVSVQVNAVVATFRFPTHDLSKLRGFNETVYRCMLCGRTLTTSRHDAEKTASKRPSAVAMG